MKITVRSAAHQHTTDIDPTLVMDAREWDRLGNVCVTRATTALERDLLGYKKEHRDHLSDMFKSMAATNRTIRRVLEPGSEDPSSVDALALARLQLECLFALCLMFEGSQHVDCYTQDRWRKQYVRYLLLRQETMALPAWEQFVSETPVDLIRLGLHFGVTQAQMSTVAFQELGKPLPAGITEQNVPPFPTPGKVIGKIADHGKRRMLERLYMNYVELCSFAHGLGEANLLKLVFDKRSPDGRMFDGIEKEKKFNTNVSGQSHRISFLSIAQSTAELTKLYPSDMELSVAASNAWNQLRGASLFTKAIWELRTKKLLGILG